MSGEGRSVTFRESRTKEPGLIRNWHGDCFQQSRTQLLHSPCLGDQLGDYLGNYPGNLKVPAMSQRETNLLWLHDMLEHLMQCQQQLAWAEDEDSVQVLTETMLRDLESCRRLLAESMHRRRQMAAV